MNEMFYSKYFFGKGVVKECMWVKARMHAVQHCKFEHHILSGPWLLNDTLHHSK